MKSIKPGRGPSGIGFISTLVSCVFGVVWTVMAVAVGAPWIFPVFGVCFVGLGILQAVYHYKNATGRNRYSTFDIVDEDEEPDPLAARYRAETPGTPPAATAGEGGFCPWCGAPVQTGHRFCRRCGKPL